MAIATQKLVGTRLEEARVAAGWTQADLWLAYRSAGGSSSMGAMEEWLRGNRDIKVSQFVILTHVLDERLKEVGEEPMFLLSHLSLVQTGSEADNGTGDIQNISG
jgi:hypothetical protein